MIAAIGVVLVFGMVFGGYIASGGKMDIIVKALPYEITIILGAALGALAIANGASTLKHLPADIKKSFAGPKWKKQDFEDSLCLLAELIKTYRNSPLEIESHIENPETSTIFEKYPRLLKDKTSTEMICDTFRSATMNFDDPNQVEELLDKRLAAHSRHSVHSSHVLQTMADGLPALGIVAAVLGVIKTMGSIDQPPEILGKMIGGALVGTFLGVFLAYGIVGPIAGKLKEIAVEEKEFYFTMREVLVACMRNHPPRLCLEIGRQNISEKNRPSFLELEDAMRNT